eukprot:scaffold54495_cov58-Phaeocystis_antarctica.AAC.4
MIAAAAPRRRIPISTPLTVSPPPTHPTSFPQSSLLDQAARAWRRSVCPPSGEGSAGATARVRGSSCVFTADLASTRALVRRHSKFELEEPYREKPAVVGVPVVGERADLEVLAGCGGRPLGGRPVVGERVCAAVLPVAVAVGGDLRPRSEVRISRVDLDVLRVGWRLTTAILPVSAAPGVFVVKREDEVDVVVAVHAVVLVRVEVAGARRVARIRQFPRASAMTAHLLLPASDAGVVVLAIDMMLRRPLPVHEQRRRVGRP